MVTLLAAWLRVADVDTTVALLIWCSTRLWLLGIGITMAVLTCCAAWLLWLTGTGTTTVVLTCCAAWLLCLTGTGTIVMVVTPMVLVEVVVTFAGAAVEELCCWEAVELTLDD